MKKIQNANGKKIITITIGVALILAVCAAFAVLFNVKPKTIKASNMSTIAEALYPTKTSLNNKLEPENTFMSDLKKFSANSSSVVFLKNKSDGNMMYSPLSLYFSLALASGGAKGETQAEFLNALSMNGLSTDDIAAQSDVLFRSLYTDNEKGRLKIANSLWLSKNMNFNKSFLQMAAKHYYASSYSVDFGSLLTAGKIGKWISDNTGGKLGGDIETDPSEVLSLINTVYFYDQWSDGFDKNSTKMSTFHTKTGDVQCDFMNKKTTGYFARGDGYTEAAYGFNNNETMLFILPDKGVTLDEITSDKQKLYDALDYKNGKGEGKRITFKIPKFSFDSKFDLEDTLQSMGVKSAFEGGVADFSNISSGIYISKVHQDTHISIDEKGCEAAAYTEIQFEKAAIMAGKGDVDMILDRPFLFAVIHKDGLPVFVGSVNNPLKK